MNNQDQQYARRRAAACRASLALAAALCSPGLQRAQALTPTTTVLTPSQLSITYMRMAIHPPIRLTATVKAAGKTVSPGLVRFCVATAKLCEGSAFLGQASLDSAGSASINHIFAVGVTPVKALFAGTRQFGPSTSGTQTITAGGMETETRLTSSRNGNVFNFSATVSGGGTLPITGNVSFVANNGTRNLGSVALGASTTTLTFGGLGFSSNGIEPLALGAGDFNGDGFTDLAIINQISNMLEIVSVTGGATKQISLQGSGAIAIAVADFNQDGKLDLAVANQDSNSITIYLGNGDLSFTQGATIPSGGNGPSGVIAVDCNRDGILDLAVTNLLSSTVTVLLGKGDGTFALFTPANGLQPATGSFPYGLVTGDFDGDGNSDLAVANYFSNDVTILLGKGDGSFVLGTSPGTGVYPDAITLADFNNDGKPDLAVTNQFSGNVTILLGKGDGTFNVQSASPVVGSKPNAVMVADFNQDGIEDLGIASFGSNSATFLLGKGDGTFPNSTSFPIGPGSTPHSIVAGDFGGAGILAAAVGNSGNNTVSVLFPGLETTATATLNAISFPVAGPHPVVATYAGSNYYLSSPGQIQIVSTPIPTTTTLTATPNPASAGSVIFLKATVSPASLDNFTAGGMVTFYNGTTVVGQGNIVNGTVAVGVSFALGTYQLTAKFSGDTNFQTSTSPVLTLNVAVLGPVPRVPAGL